LVVRSLIAQWSESSSLSNEDVRAITVHSRHVIQYRFISFEDG